MNFTLSPNISLNVPVWWVYQLSVRPCKIAAAQLLKYSFASLLSAGRRLGFFLEEIHYFKGFIFHFSKVVRTSWVLSSYRYVLV
jgi:hypothetical protein